MKPDTMELPSPEAPAAPASKLEVDLKELVTACLVAALLTHLIFASAGGTFLFPWLGRFFAEAPKLKVEKKEVVEVEMVEAVVAEPPPPDVQPAPPDQPPPPPDAIQPPMEPQLSPPVLSTPAEVPERTPLPAPVVAKLNPAALLTPRTNVAPYVPSAAVGATQASTTTTPRVVQARFYQRNEPVYPYEARKRRIQGTVILEAVFSPDGRLGSLEIKESSGHALLDRAAVAHGTQSFYSTTGQAERVLIPVEFRLIAQ